MQTSSPEPQDPYRAPQAEITSVLVSSSLADRWIRLAASLIDAVIGLIVMAPLMFLGGYWQTAHDASRVGGIAFMPLGTTLLWAAIGFVVFALLQGYPLHASGQTWGKKILSIRIVDLQGRKPPLSELLLKRYLPTHVIVSIPCLGTIYALVDSLMIFREDHRCLHDHIAGTRVVKVE